MVGFRDPAVVDSEDLAPYPLLALFRQGLPIAVCTDNPGISRTDLATELVVASRLSEVGLTLWEGLALIRQAFVHSFLSAAQREDLLEQVDARVYRLLEHQPSETM